MSVPKRQRASQRPSARSQLARQSSRSIAAISKRRTRRRRATLLPPPLPLSLSLHHLICSLSAYRSQEGICRGRPRTGAESRAQDTLQSTPTVVESLQRPAMAALIPPSQSFSLLWLATQSRTHTFCWPLWPLRGSCRSFIRPPSEIYVRARVWAPAPAGRPRRPPRAQCSRARAPAASGIAHPLLPPIRPALPGWPFPRRARACGARP